MIDAHEIKSKLALLANDKLSVNAFEKWFVPNSWNAYSEASSQAMDLVFSISSVFSERDDLRLKPQQVRANLLSILNSEAFSPAENYYRFYVSDYVLPPVEFKPQRSAAVLVRAALSV